MSSRLLYAPKEEPMSVVVFASGSGTNFEQAVSESDHESSGFSIDLLVTDKETTTGKNGEKEIIGALRIAERCRIPSITLNGYKECGSYKEAQKTIEGMRDYERRSELFNRKLLGMIQSFEGLRNKSFDFAVLAGYMRLFKGPLLRRFNMKAINVHPAALDILNHDGSRKYVGDNAVYDALKAGEKITRSSIILLDPETDAGPLLTSGPWVEYTGKRPITQDEANKHQAKQKRESDWPALRYTLKHIAQGDFSISENKYHADGNPVIFYKGEETGYGGIE